MLNNKFFVGISHKFYHKKQNEIRISFTGIRGHWKAAKLNKNSISVYWYYYKYQRHMVLEKNLAKVGRIVLKTYQSAAYGFKARINNKCSKKVYK